MTRAAGGKPEILRRLSGKLEKNKLKKWRKHTKIIMKIVYLHKKVEKREKELTTFAGGGIIKSNISERCPKIKGFLS